MAKIAQSDRANKATTPPQADGGSVKDFHLKAAAKMTLDSNCNSFLASKHYPGKQFLPVAPTDSSYGEQNPRMGFNALIINQLQLYFKLKCNL